MNANRKRIAKWLGGAVAAPVLALGIYALYQVATHNFHAVVPGQVYRSGQMDGVALQRAVQAHGLRSILNLRGSNNAGWYRDEVATAAELNVPHFDRSLSSGQELTLAEMDDLVKLLRGAPKPVLIHCQGGADRSGLASALYEVAITHRAPGAAGGELTFWRGHVPLLRPRVLAMDRSFWNYVSNRVETAAAGEALGSVKP